MVDLSAELQPEKGKEMRSNYSAVKRENGRSGVGCNPEMCGKDSSEARRRRGGAGGSRGGQGCRGGKRIRCGRGRHGGGCAQTVRQGGDGERAEGGYRWRRDVRQQRGGLNGHAERARRCGATGQACGTGAVASGAGQIEGSVTAWRRDACAENGHGRRPAWVRQDGPGGARREGTAAAWGQDGRARRVEAAAVAARTRVEAQRRAMRTQLLGGERRGNGMEGARRGRTAAEQRAAATEAGGGRREQRRGCRQRAADGVVLVFGPGTRAADWTAARLALPQAVECTSPAGCVGAGIPLAVAARSAETGQASVCIWGEGASALEASCPSHRPRPLPRKSAYHRPVSRMKRWHASTGVGEEGRWVYKGRAALVDLEVVVYPTPSPSHSAPEAAGRTHPSRPRAREMGAPGRGGGWGGAARGAAGPFWRALARRRRGLSESETVEEVAEECGERMRTEQEREGGGAWPNCRTWSNRSGLGIESTACCWGWDFGRSGRSHHAPEAAAREAESQAVVESVYE
ncbi:hypothetical protein B0H14DRAFT_2579799 [Mycena olivaceomarginata]|nr:hypothetical protein B0H14DRAFT_2579799 [Mycena olivaceomarginata]